MFTNFYGYLKGFAQQMDRFGSWSACFPRRWRWEDPSNWVYAGQLGKWCCSDAALRTDYLALFSRSLPAQASVQKQMKQAQACVKESWLL